MNHPRPFLHPQYSNLVTYPNRDATAYRDHYDIPEAETVIRSTIRYKGFPIIVQALAEIGCLANEEIAFLDSSNPPLPWREVLRLITKASSSAKPLSTLPLFRYTD